VNLAHKELEIVKNFTLFDVVGFGSIPLSHHRPHIRRGYLPFFSLSVEDEDEDAMV
jgi:hypothetical protein